MRFKKGSKVEVLCNTDCVMGSWQCAEIISGNGHTYSLSFGRFPFTSDAVVVHRVPRKVIRPCPPYVEGGTEVWLPGDLVEVFDDLSWKTARVVKAMGGNNFLVRLLFVPTWEELRVHGSHIRVRQCWQDGKWFIVGKGIESCITTSTKKKTKKQCGGEDHFLMAEKNTGSLKPQVASISTITRKRGLRFGSSHLDPYPVAAQKMRRSIEDGGDGQMVPGHDEKVDVSVSPQKIQGGKCMHASFNIGTTTVGMGEPTRFSDSFGAGNLVRNDSDSCASSVASCSVTRSSPRYLSDDTPRRGNDVESYCSDDAESFCGRGCEDEGCSPSLEKELVLGEVPRAKLGVYSCIAESLYAAGPWTWEEEGHVRHCNNFVPTNSTLIIT